MDQIRLWLPALLALLIAASGWFYMFYSRAAHRLAGVEEQKTNARRRRLRQVNGLVMMLLAIAFFAGFYTFDPDRAPTGFMLTWLAALALLAIVVALALVDVRMTVDLRRRRNDR
jgi:Na+/H+ antiporter NhaD/arsenite permease-like protein